MVNLLNPLKTTTGMLLQALRAGKLNKAHEAVTKLAMQGVALLGHEHPAMQQFFPVWSAIESHISAGDTERALGHAEEWNRLLDELVKFVEAAMGAKPPNDQPGDSSGTPTAVAGALFALTSPSSAPLRPMRRRSSRAAGVSQLQQPVQAQFASS